eukprot:12916136-Prorocentrum_lima.AAC.1
MDLVGCGMAACMLYSIIAKMVLSGGVIGKTRRLDDVAISLRGGSDCSGVSQVGRKKNEAMAYQSERRE